MSYEELTVLQDISNSLQQLAEVIEKQMEDQNQMLEKLLYLLKDR